MHEDPLDAFTDALRGQNRSEHTVRAYHADLGGLLGFLEVIGVVLEHVTLADLHRWLASLADTNSGATRARKVHAVRAFFRWREDVLRLPSPAARLAAPKKEQREMRALTETEYRTVRDLVREEPRLAAIVEVLLQTGLRVSELVALLREDVTWSARAPDGSRSPARLRVRLGKGRKDREPALNRVAEQALKRYLNERPRLDERPWLFLSRRGRQLSARSVHHMLASVYRQLGIPGAAVHTLRHTHATEHVRRGTDLIALGYQLGHASVASTEKYVRLVRERLEVQMEENAL